MSTDPRTVAFYDTEAETYSKWADGFGLPDYFPDFVATLPQAARVLDFGCGGGWAARAFHDLGFQVTALDPSAGMIAQIGRTEGIATICGDVTAIAPRVFEAIWAHFSLQHIPREELPAALALLHAALVPGGGLFIGIHEGTKTHRDSLNRLYNPYSETALRQALEQAGFSVETLSRAKDKSYDGHPVDMMRLRVLRNA